MILSKRISLKILEYLLSQLEKLNLFPVIGVELEFYLLPLDIHQHDKIWKAPNLELNFPLELEKGDNQFEFKLEYNSNIVGQLAKIEEMKQSLINQAKIQKVEVSFSAKPFAQQPGSALHIHLHLENNLGENLYIKQTDQETSLMLESIAGLCSTLKENMLLFAPTKESYLRYRVDHITTPSKICWGGNNRSAAIRIPLAEKENRRLEHRVAAADSEPLEVIIAILYGVLKGVRERLVPPEKIHGNAFLQQYEYPYITRDYETAQQDFYNSAIFQIIKSIT